MPPDSVVKVAMCSKCAEALWQTTIGSPEEKDILDAFGLRREPRGIVTDSGALWVGA
ncbi:MAG: hypothetical protein KatS3mg082_1427 [Nitrospiraceae bacterium]|nr:MAG: hypothetical protein KatS3mg082_1427 [Nitrospiraceae bacterium]